MKLGVWGKYLQGMLGWECQMDGGGNVGVYLQSLFIGELEW